MAVKRTPQTDGRLTVEESASLERRFWRFSLRTTILTLIVSIITLLSSVLIYTAWYYSSANAKNLSRRLMSRIAAHVVYRTTRYLEPAETGAALSRMMSRSETVKHGDPREIEQFFIHLLQVHPQLAMLNYGDEHGNFVMVKRFPVDTEVKGYPIHRLHGGVGDPVHRAPFTGSAAEAALRKRALEYVWAKGLTLGAKQTGYVVPKGSLSTKIIRRDGTSPPVVLWKYRDGNRKLTSLWASAKPVYDPRPRPWYVQSKKTRRQGWTPVYLFFTDQKPGIASASPIFAPNGAFSGAVTVEIELFRISEFLAASRIGPESSVFLINDSKQVVAYSDTAKFRKRIVVAGKPKWVLRKVDDLPDKAVVKSFAELRKRSPKLPPSGQHLFSFEHDDQTWQAMYIPFPASAGNRWTVGVVVPEDAFLRQIKRNRWMAVFISLMVSFAAVLIAAYLSRSISQPLNKLVKETERIRDLDLRGDVRVKSSLAEVDAMASSVDSMKAGLRSFEKYVPRELVKQLVFSGEEAIVQGETRELTVMFTDIAGFTSISEGLAPEQLVAHLNRYFDEATNVLQAHGGTIDKYIGDAVMAFWGAPREMPDHAERACRAALGLQQALRELNAAWEETGVPPMHTRIGVHTGEVIVGNIGSDERLAYTIIGDGVNLASRIEGINKQYGTWVMVSHETYNRVKDIFVGRAVDIVAVKGRRTGELLYELRGLRAGVDGDTADHVQRELDLEAICEAAFDPYRDRRWEDATACWRQALELLGGRDQASALLIARTQDYLAEPPPREWTGTFIATSK